MFEGELWRSSERRVLQCFGRCFACHSITSILLPENDRKLLTKENILGEWFNLSNIHEWQCCRLYSIVWSIIEPKYVNKCSMYVNWLLSTKHFPINACSIFAVLEKDIEFTTKCLRPKSSCQIQPIDLFDIELPLERIEKEL